MTAVQGSPRFTGFVRRLVDEGHLSAEKMQAALQNAKKAKQDIVPHLIHEYQLSPRTIAETISMEFGEPVFDISTYDTALIIRDEFEDKLDFLHKSFFGGVSKSMLTLNETIIDVKKG